MSAAPHPVLYSFRRCPYAMRARLALQASQQRCELREVVLRDKPPELLALSAKSTAAKATVPILITPDGRVIAESLDIMLWALQQSDPGQWLVPERGSLEDMLQLVAQFDDGFKPHLDHYKYPGHCHDNQDSAQAHRAACAAYLQNLNTTLRDTAFLFGHHAALADMAIAPFVRQFAGTDAAWFSQQPWPHLQAWLAAWQGSDLFARVMYKYAPWQSATPGVIFPAT